MRRFTFCAAVLASLAVAGKSWADLDNTNKTSQQLRLELALMDGSRINP